MKSKKGTEGIEIVAKGKAPVVMDNRGITITHRQKPITRQEMGVIGYVYLLIDCSGSMAFGRKLEQALAGARGFAQEAMQKGYRVGVISFAGTTHHICAPQSDITKIDRFLTISRWELEGWTNIAAAIRLGIQKLQERKGFRALVLITDGQPNVGRPSPEKAALKEARNAKSFGIDILTIGTDNAELSFLERLATRTELASYVTKENLSEAISSSAQLLQGPKNIIQS